MFVVKVKLPAQSEEVSATPGLNADGSVAAGCTGTGGAACRRPGCRNAGHRPLASRHRHRPRTGSAPAPAAAKPNPPPARRRSLRAAAWRSRRRPSMPRCRGTAHEPEDRSEEPDFNDIGNWPQKAKIVFCSLLALVIMFVAWMLLISGKREELASLESKEVELRTEFTKQQERAVNLGPLKQQLAQMEQVLQQMLRQLPARPKCPT
jgi:hypothetical protein